MELMSNIVFWKEVSCPADYYHLGVFSKERMQCMLFIAQLKTHVKMSDDFVGQEKSKKNSTIEWFDVVVLKYVQ